MKLPRQPLPVKITIDADNDLDIERVADMIRKMLENNYASTTGYHSGFSYVLHAYPFAVND